MRFQTLFPILAQLLLAACGNGGGGSGGGSSIEGPDYSGTYVASMVECYSSTTANLTAQATFNAATPTERITLSGNSGTVVDTDSNCTGTETNRMVFVPADNLVRVTNRRTTTNTGATCTQTFTLVPSWGGTITPSSFNGTINHNASPSDRNFNYVRNSSTGHVGLYSIFTVQGSPTDVCFVIYLKQ